LPELSFIYGKETLLFLNAELKWEFSKKEKRVKRLYKQLVLGFILILVIPALDHRLGWSHVPVYIVILGDILLIVGYYLVFLVLKVNSFASITIEVATDQKVISTGPYGMVRHPCI
jgi:protein-S-isoprenylcysteine O-methyltransferase Ste14